VLFLLNVYYFAMFISQKYCYIYFNECFILLCVTQLHMYGVGTWWHSIMVRTQVSAGELSLSCARLLAGWVTTLWLSRPLLVIQHRQLSHPSLRGR